MTRWRRASRSSPTRCGPEPRYRFLDAVAACGGRGLPWCALRAPAARVAAARAAAVPAAVASARLATEASVRLLQLSTAPRAAPQAPGIGAPPRTTVARTFTH